MSGVVYRFISVYSPCEGAVSERLDDFYSDLNDVIYRRSSEKVILLGDLNARVGRNDPNFANILGKFGEESPANNNGKRLLDFCQSSGLIITNTFFKHKKIHTYSWENPGQNQKSLLDYVIVEECLRKSVMNSRVYRSFGLDSDHYLVASKLCITNSRINSYRKPSNKLRVNRLKDENVAREFVDILEEKFSGLNENVADIETEWGLFKNTVLGAARECLGFVRNNSNGRKKTDWWNNEIKAAVKEKRAKWIQWTQNRTEENWNSYKEQRANVKQMVKEAKEGNWVKFGEELEEAGQQRNKVFWTKVKNIRNGGKKQAPGAVLDNTGSMVMGRNNVLNRWEEYFDDLLNVENGAIGQS